MMIKAKWIILTVIVLLSFGLRVMHYHDTFSDDESYFNLRHSILVKDNLMFSFYDDLSYGGREYYYPPLFYMIMALFIYLFNSLSVFIPQLIFSLTAIIVFYFIGDDFPGLFGAAVFATLPFLSYYLSNNLFQIMISIPLLVLALYFFSKVDKDDKSITLYLISFILLVLGSPLCFFLVSIELSYFIISRVEGKQLSVKEIELFLFSLFFSLWFYMILFKRQLLKYGLSAISRNIPKELFTVIFHSFTPLSLVSLIGSLTIIIGTYMLYKSIVDYRNKNYYLISSGIIVSLLAIIIRATTLEEGIVILSVFIAIMSGYFIKEFNRFIKKTKVSRYSTAIISIIIIVILSSNVFYAVTNEKGELITNDEKRAFYSLRSMTPEGSIIFAPYFYGNFITFYGNRKNVMDNIFTSDSEIRLKDIEDAYKTHFETEALEIFDKYHADYIIDSKRIDDYYNISKIDYINDERCFSKTYIGKEISIYKIKCHIKKSKRNLK